MKDIDTIILCACGTKIISYIGIFKCLFTYKVIDINKLTTYISCSAGSIISLALILFKSLSIFEKFINKYPLKQYIDINDLNDLFNNNGLFTKNKILKTMRLMIKYKYNQENITFRQLYEKTKITNIIQVYNLSLHKKEYLSHKTAPDMNIIDAIDMTVSIPIIFKPVIYNDQYYIDGGVTGVVPIYKATNYLVIHISSNKGIPFNNKLDYIHNLFYTIGNSCNLEDIYDKRYILYIPIDMSMVNFDITKELIHKINEQSYKLCEDHIKLYKLS